MSSKPQTQDQDSRPVFFFDIDNCLYSSTTGIHVLMGELIDKYFQTHLSLSPADSSHLHNKYYTEYGLALEGLVRHHKVDALEYNALVDDALPLDSILSPDPALQSLLSALDTRKVKPWLFTNAYVSHGERVAKLLGVRGFFEGITYCDYAQRPLICKPHSEMFSKAEREAGAEGRECFLVDDSGINVRAARERGWTSVHFVEAARERPERMMGTYQVERLEELRGLFPDFFKDG